MSEIGLYHYLALGLIMFLIGLIGSITVKNVIKVLIAIEFMLTGININFIAFASYGDSTNLNGYIFSLFYIGLGAVELAIGLFIFYLMYKHKRSSNINNYNEL